MSIEISWKRTSNFEYLVMLSEFHAILFPVSGVYEEQRRV
jgi:hypothetical protein